MCLISTLQLLPTESDWLEVGTFERIPFSLPVILMNVKSEMMFTNNTILLCRICFYTLCFSIPISAFSKDLWTTLNRYCFDLPTKPTLVLDITNNIWAVFYGKFQSYSVATEELSLVIQHNLIEGLLLLLLVAMIKTMTKATTGRKVFFSHSSDTPSPGGRPWSRHHGVTLLPGLILIAWFTCFLLAPETPSWGVTTHSGLNPPSSLIS